METIEKALAALALLLSQIAGPTLDKLSEPPTPAQCVTELRDEFGHRHVMIGTAAPDTLPITFETPVRNTP
jgi:hypothetical protein